MIQVTLAELTGAAHEVNWRGRAWRVTPLRLRELGMLEAAAGKQKLSAWLATRDGAGKALWMMLRPEQPAVSRETVDGLLDQSAIADLATALRMESEPRVAWRTIFAALAAEYSWSYREIGELTPAQALAAYLARGHRATRRFTSLAAWQAHLRRVKSRQTGEGN